MFITNWCNSLNWGPKVDQKGLTLFEKVDLVKGKGKSVTSCVAGMPDQYPLIALWARKGDTHAENSSMGGSWIVDT